MYFFLFLLRSSCLSSSLGAGRGGCVRDGTLRFGQPDGCRCPQRRGVEFSEHSQYGEGTTFLPLRGPVSEGPGGGGARWATCRERPGFGSHSREGRGALGSPQPGGRVAEPRVGTEQRGCGGTGRQRGREPPTPLCSLSAQLFRTR